MEISALLQHSTLRQPSSVELGWKHFAIERRTILPGERPEFPVRHHFLILWDGHVAEGETAHRSGRFVAYKKFPNTVTTCPPGIRRAVRSRSKHEVIVGAFDPDFLRVTEEELEKPARGTFRQLYGTDDPDLRYLLVLLVKESETGGRRGPLYAESLVTALAVRLLDAGRSEMSHDKTTISPLSPRSLRRVVDRMQSDLSANVDLATLAAASGYSKAHFLRSFRAATGQTPHRYLTDLRLRKAEALIAGGSMSLVDVAAVCGFSSHAHLTTAFRARFGLPPSAFRRGSQPMSIR